MPKKTLKYKQAKKYTKKMETQFNKCEKKKCATQTKRKLKMQKLFKKLEKKQCAALKSADDFNNCSNKIYTETGYEKVVQDLLECGSKHCSREKKEKAQAYEEEFAYLATPSFIK